MSKTRIQKNHKDYEIPNNDLIQFLIKNGINIDSRISTNSYFKYNLFNIFKPVIREKIYDLNICKDMISLQISKYRVNILVNEYGGLSFESPIINTYQGNLIANSQFIVEIFPYINGIICIRHSKTSIGLVDSNCRQTDEHLEIDYINEHGFVDRNYYITCSNKKGNSLKYNKLERLNIEQYKSLFKKMKFNGDYIKRTRNQKDIFSLTEIKCYNRIKKKEIKKFCDANILNLLDLNNCYYKVQKYIDYEKIYYELNSITTESDIVLDIYKYIIMRLESRDIDSLLGIKKLILMYS